MNSEDEKKEETKKKLTVTEFKTWLEGAEAFQEEEWTPDHKQWKIIRSKIDNLIEESSSQTLSFPPGMRTTPATFESALSAPPPSQPPVSQIHSPQQTIQRSPRLESSNAGLARGSDNGYESTFK